MYIRLPLPFALHVRALGFSGAGKLQDACKGQLPRLCWLVLDILGNVVNTLKEGKAFGGWQMLFCFKICLQPLGICGLCLCCAGKADV